jgi:hypothetical protein
VQVVEDEFQRLAYDGMCTLDGIMVHITIRRKNNELVDVSTSWRKRQCLTGRDCERGIKNAAIGLHPIPTSDGKPKPSRRPH